jgi:glycosyltransferase 2 family protein
MNFAPRKKWFCSAAQSLSAIPRFTNDHTRRMRNFIRRFGLPLLKLLVLALVVWGGHRTLSAGFAELHQNGWQLDQLQPAWAGAAAMLYLIGQLPSGWFWQRVLAALGQTVGLWRALRAFYIGHLGKYVPGKAMVVVLRAALLGQPYVKTSLAVVAVFYETFTTMAVGAVLAAVILLVGHREQTWLIAAAIALALLVGVPTLPPIFVRLMRAMRVIPASSEDAASSMNVRVGLLIPGWIAIAVGWFYMGASLWATVRAIGIGGANLIDDLPLYTATVALAVASGFVSMLPAGIGVREMVLLELLAPQLEQLAAGHGQQLALVAVIALRLIWLIAEAIVAAIAYPLGAIMKDNK